MKNKEIKTQINVRFPQFNCNLKMIFQN